MRIVDIEEMKEIELLSWEHFGFSESLIIENVGIQGSLYLFRKFIEKGLAQEVVFFVGRGNNGADALAIARNMANIGVSTRVFVLWPPDQLNDNAANYLRMAENFGAKISFPKDIEAIQSYFFEMTDSFLVIDGIFGTGVRHPMPALVTDAINFINENDSMVVSIDIPTGVHGNTGLTSNSTYLKEAGDNHVTGTGIEADYTLCVGLPKKGLFIADGQRLKGETHVLDANMPKKALTQGEMFQLSPDSVSVVIDKRSEFAHKNTFGHVLVIGGSQGMTGALILAGRSALRVGGGLVTLATWRDSYNELVYQCDAEIMTGVIPDREGDYQDVINTLDKYDAVVIGPGLGKGESVRGLVSKLLRNFKGPVVIDADGINALSLNADEELLGKRKAPVILTPHFGEFSRFLGKTVQETADFPIENLKEAVEQVQCGVVLKGSCTYLAFPSGEIFFNDCPNDGMAKGGSGDVLAGVLGGLLGQKQAMIKRTMKSRDNINPQIYYESVCLGVVLHSVAGMEAASAEGTRFMTAGSIINHLGNGLKKIEGHGESTT